MVSYVQGCLATLLVELSPACELVRLTSGKHHLFAEGPNTRLPSQLVLATSAVQARRFALACMPGEGRVCLFSVPAVLLKLASGLQGVGVSGSEVLCARAPVALRKRVARAGASVFALASATAAIAMWEVSRTSRKPLVEHRGNEAIELSLKASGRTRAAHLPHRRSKNEKITDRRGKPWGDCRRFWKLCHAASLPFSASRHHYRQHPSARPYACGDTRAQKPP